MSGPLHFDALVHAFHAVLALEPARWATAKKTG